MPTYEYLCLSCGDKFERFQGISDNPLESCPSCEGVVKRLISGGRGFIMKGGSTSLGGSSSGCDATSCTSSCSSCSQCGH
ncbi:MAG: zinc ribbon domain-containing protein [Spirochaetota bacterium]|nr:zinc ribbon domain-containing protein [Spirochaetota bacterium]